MNSQMTMTFLFDYFTKEEKKIIMDNMDSDISIKYGKV